MQNGIMHWATAVWAALLPASWILWQLWDTPHTDAASVGAAAGGCLEVASFDGKAVGDLVIFRVVDADPTN